MTCPGIFSAELEERILPWLPVISSPVPSPCLLTQVQETQRPLAWAHHVCFHHTGQGRPWTRRQCLFWNLSPSLLASPPVGGGLCTIISFLASHCLPAIPSLSSLSYVPRWSYLTHLPLDVVPSSMLWYRHSLVDCELPSGLRLKPVGAMVAWFCLPYA